MLLYCTAVCTSYKKSSAHHILFLWAMKMFRRYIGLVIAHIMCGICGREEAPLCNARGEIHSGRACFGPLLDSSSAFLLSPYSFDVKSAVSIAALSSLHLAIHEKKKRSMNEPAEPPHDRWLKVRERFADLNNAPCFRNSLLWGITAGALMGGHKFRMGSEC